MPKGDIFMHKIIDPGQQINVGIMERYVLGIAGTAAGQPLIVLAVIAIATFHVTRINGRAAFALNDFENHLFGPPDHPLFYFDQPAVGFAFDHLRIL